MESAELKDRLVPLARELAPHRTQGATNVVDLAVDRGIDVKVVLASTARRRCRLIYSNPPEVHILRPSRRTGSWKLSRDDDKLLSNDERFSVAHELGHWLAHSLWGVEPIDHSDKSKKSDYWKHEASINSFVGELLVPEWRLQSWLSGRPDGYFIGAEDINRWSAEARVSRIVSARRVCDHRSDMGFMELRFEKKDRRQALKVTESASGSSLKIPNTHKVIYNDRLIDIFRKPHGAVPLRGTSLDGRTVGNYVISWAQDSFRSAPIGARYLWTSWMSLDGLKHSAGTLL